MHTLTHTHLYSYACILVCCVLDLWIGNVHVCFSSTAVSLLLSASSKTHKWVWLTITIFFFIFIFFRKCVFVVVVGFLHFKINLLYMKICTMIDNFIFFFKKKVVVSSLQFERCNYGGIHTHYTQTDIRYMRRKQKKKKPRVKQREASNKRFHSFLLI